MLYKFGVFGFGTKLDGLIDKHGITALLTQLVYDTRARIVGNLVTFSLASISFDVADE